MIVTAGAHASRPVIPATGGAARPTSQNTRRSPIGTRLAELTEAVARCAALLAHRDTPDAVHEARIAIRRLRGALKGLQDYLHAPTCRHCMRSLTALMKACDEVRDADVREELLRALLEQRGMRDTGARALLAAAAEESDAERRKLRRRTTAPRWNRRLQELRESAAGLSIDAPAHRAKDVVADVLLRERRRLQRRWRKGLHGPRKLHRIRLLIKDARYFVEDFGALGGAATADSETLRGVQKTLGQLHDEWRLRKWLRRADAGGTAARVLREHLKTHERKLERRARRMRASVLG